ncbi:hypothetical protein NKI04_32860 [Mesorhizobium sp. M0814]|uniref:hypothetical protein n=1 Tax=Mesorhizobium sp. M0814 TaxID=2957004 RepID=UPI003334FC95
MNFKRGLFRLWLMMTAVWVLAAGALGYPEISRDRYFLSPFEIPADVIAIVPVLCGKVRGEAGKDYTTKENQHPGPWDTYATPNAFENCWYEMPVFRKLWPEYADLSDDALSDNLYKDSGIKLNVPDPLSATKRVALFAFIPPIALLLFGSLIVWVNAGFGRPKEPPLAQ